MTVPSSSVPDGGSASRPPGGEPTPVVVYEPSLFALPALRQYVRQVLERRSLMWNLARSQLKADNYDTVLGQVWLILNPLLLAGVYVLVRGVLRQVGSTPLERNAIIAHLVMGVFFYRFASNIVTGCASSILRSKGMVLNTNFPRMVFPLIGVIKSTLEFLPTVVVLVLVHYLLGQPFGWSLLSVPLIWFMLLIFSFGAGLFLAVCTVWVRDTSNVLTFIMRLLFFMTPIIYRVSEIPPAMKPYLQFNPLFPAFWALEEAWQARWPTLGQLGWFGAWMLGALLLGLWFFISRERSFASKL